MYNSDDGIISIGDGYLFSIWATPILLLEFKDRENITEECWCYADEHSDWNEKTRWPEEALNKFIKSEEGTNSDEYERRRDD